MSGRRNLQRLNVELFPPGRAKAPAQRYENEAQAKEALRKARAKRDATMAREWAKGQPKFEKRERLRARIYWNHPDIGKGDKAGRLFRDRAGTSPNRKHRAKFTGMVRKQKHLERQIRMHNTRMNRAIDEANAVDRDTRKQMRERRAPPIPPKTKKKKAAAAAGAKQQPPVKKQKKS